MSVLIHVLGMNQLLQQCASCYIRQTCVLADTRVPANLVPYQASLCPPSFLANSLGNAYCSNSPGLSDNDIAIPLIFGILIQDVLRNLCGFTTTCGS